MLSRVVQFRSASAVAAQPHIVSAIDCVVGADGRQCLVFPLLESGVVAALIRSRSTIAPGELITLFAPLANAVAALHSRGIAHGGLRFDAILFDSRGSPMLGCFGAATLHDAAPLALGSHAHGFSQRHTRPDAITADLVALSTLVRVALKRVPKRDCAGAPAQLARWLTAAPPRRGHYSPHFAAADAAAAGAEFAQQLSARLFELGEPLPFPVPSAPAEFRTPKFESIRARPPAAERSNLDRLVERENDAFDGSFSSQIRARAVKALAPVRRPLWIAGGAGALALVAALTLVPAAQSTPQQSAPQQSAPQQSAAQQSAAQQSAAQQSTPQQSSAQQSAAQQSAAQQSAPASETAPTASALATPARAGLSTAEFLAVVSGDDPVAAATALLGERAHCLNERSESCLSRCNQPGSAASEADRQLIQQLTRGVAMSAESLHGTAQPKLIQTLGNSAILSIAQPNSEPNAVPNAEPNAEPTLMLIIKGVAHWQIRDLGFSQ